MNNTNMSSLLKVILVCLLLFMFSPLIFGVFKFILWLILALIIIITLVIMYIRYKANKELKEFEEMTDNTMHSSTYEYNSNDDIVDIDYGDAPIVDVYEYEEDDDNNKN